MKLADIINQNLVLEEKAIALDTELVSQIQSRLSALGYYPPKKVDGKYGPLTRGAIVNFCSANNLNNAVNGRYGSTWASALIKSESGSSILEKYTKGKPYLIHTFTGRYDQHDFKIFLLQLVNDGKVIDQLHVISGSPKAQKNKLLDPKADYSGSGNPIPEGIYKVGKVIRMSAPERGVGYVKVPLDVLPEFRVNNRSEFLCHPDFNRQIAIGSLGCIVTYSEKDMDRIVSWCEQKNRPEILFVDYQRGLLKERGIQL